MKDLKRSREWFTLAAKELNRTELAVFICWYTDSPDFSAGASLLHQRLPFIKRQNVAKALKGLLKKGFVIKTDKVIANSKGKPTPVLALNASLQMHYQDDQGTSIMHLSEGHNASLGIPKCISRHACSRKEEEKKKEEEERSSTSYQLHQGGGEPALKIIPPGETIENDIMHVSDQVKRLEALFKLYEEGQINLTKWELDNYPEWLRGLKKYGKRPLTERKLKNLEAKEKKSQIPLTRYKAKTYFKEISSWLRLVTPVPGQTLESAYEEVIGKFVRSNEDGELRIALAMKHVNAETAQDLITSALKLDEIASTPVKPNESKPIDLFINNNSAGSVLDKLEEFDVKKLQIYKMPKEFQKELTDMRNAITRSGDDTEIDQLLNKFNNLFAEASKNQQAV